MKTFVLIFLAVILPIPQVFAMPAEKPSYRTCSSYKTIAGIDCSSFPKDPGDNYRASQTPYHVSPIGNDSNPGTEEKPFRTISHALEVSKNGATVMVHGGTYEEGSDGEFRAIVLNKKGLILRAAKDGTVTVKPKSKNITYGMAIESNDIIVDGINLSGFSSAMITMEPGTKNIILKNMNVAGACKDFCDGIVIQEGGMDGLLIRNVTVTGADLGISCNRGPCNNWWIDKVKVVARRGDDNSGADAIAAESGSNWLISDSDVTGASGDGIDLKASRVTVYNSNVHDNERNGIKLWRGGDVVNSYVVNHGADAAVVFDRAGTYRILNSLVAYENFGKGRSYTMTVGYDNPSDTIKLSLINSVFYNNSGGVYLSGGTDAVIRNCLFGNTDNDEILIKGDVTVTESDSTSKTERLANASGNLKFKTNPGFKDPPSDFRFSSSSPLADAGVRTDSFPLFDFKGKPRVKGKAPDLGPAELN